MNYIADRGVVTSAVETIGPGMFFNFIFIHSQQEITAITQQYSVGLFNTDSVMPVLISNVVSLSIQGLLEPPLGISLSDSETDDGLTRVLSWNAPETLDITKH